MNTIDRAAAALNLTIAALSALLVDVAGRHGYTVGLNTWEAYPPARRDTLAVGDLVLVYAYQRYRVAVVWNRTPTKLSAVYLTPSEVQAGLNTGRPIHPNNITAPISACAMIPGARAFEAPAAPAPAGGSVQLDEAAATDDAIHAGMLPLAGGEGFLF